MTKIKAMRDKILAIMVDDPDAEIKKEFKGFERPI